jgi:hypothetical protein
LYACPFCEGSYPKWQEPLKDPDHPEKGGRDPFPKRTLDNIKANFAKYQADGSRKDRAKTISKSIVSEPLVPVPPEDVMFYLILTVQSFILFK